jgi:hypothetical protein
MKDFRKAKKVRAIEAFFRTGGAGAWYCLKTVLSSFPAFGATHPVKRGKEKLESIH